tara:strand:- start:5344 stop:5985 length:642 start_codon:yes stop_codon:yes gene_type:complete
MEETRSMRVKKMQVKQLAEDPSNARQHSERNIDSIKKSLDQFGQQKPIVVDKNNRVIAGNGTLQAASSLGWKEIAVAVTDLEADEAQAFAIADNRTAELAAWNEEELAAQIGSFDDKLLSASGFTQDEMIELLADVDTGTGDWMEPVEEIRNENLQPGHLTYDGIVKQVHLTFSQEEYGAVVAALESLREKYGQPDFTNTIIRVLRELGYEIP